MNKGIEGGNVKARMPWVDIAKGILILLVILGHVHFYAYQHLAVDDFKFVEKTHILFITWYMPAFFVIAGFCSNFNIPFKEFLLKNFKSLIIPSILIGVFFSLWISLFLSSQGLSYKNFANLNYWSLLITCGPWFLPALFIAKIIWYLLHNYMKWGVIWNAFFLLAMMLAASILYNRNLILNVWYFEHALLLLPFLFAGYLLRRYQISKSKKIACLFVGSFFLAVAIFMRRIGLPYPYIVGLPGVFWGNFWLCLLMGVSGSLALMVICEKIGRCRLLEFLGRHTITIYLLQESIIVAFMKVCLYFDINMHRIVVVVLLVFLTAFTCAWMDVLINKHMSFLKGKF